ncbi:MAG: ATP-binding cassette domain-containing protein [Bacteroidetes bacterium]|nr:ATP-binding cassette domain-containing protein [Bacteroidota bacterium]
MPQKLKLQNVVPSYLPEKYVLNSGVWNQSFEIDSGSHFQFQALSGKGKSTLINCLFGALKSYSGDITIGGISLKTANHQQLSSLRSSVLSCVPQGLGLFQNLTLKENIELKNALTKHKTEQEIAEMAEQLGINSVLHQKASTASFGQRQRAAIIRALCQPFAFLLLDEPFSHLDNDSTSASLTLILNEAEKQNASVVLTTHHSTNHPSFKAYEI